MPQISIYVNDSQFKTITDSAKRAGESISKWVVGKVLQKSETDGYSRDFVKLFGSIKDDSFIEPSDQAFENDAEREKL